MEFLSEEDVSIRDMTQAELDAYWWHWFIMAQATNATDPIVTHGPLAGLTAEEFNRMLDEED